MTHTRHMQGSARRFAEAGNASCSLLKNAGTQSA